MNKIQKIGQRKKYKVYKYFAKGMLIEENERLKQKKINELQKK